jgi:hypothetical protein
VAQVLRPDAGELEVRIQARPRPCSNPRRQPDELRDRPHELRRQGIGSGITEGDARVNVVVDVDDLQKYLDKAVSLAES